QDRAFFFQRPQVIDRGGLAREAEVLLDFARRRHDAGALLFVLDEIENGLLFFGERFHVHSNTSRQSARDKAKFSSSAISATLRFCVQKNERAVKEVYTAASGSIGSMWTSTSAISGCA